MEPTLAGYLQFLRDVVGVPVSALPDDSPYISLTFNAAIEIVWTPFTCMGFPDVYMQAVYNLAAHMLVCMAPDQTGSTFFADLRKKCGVNNFQPGLIQSSSDENTSQSWMIPDVFKKATLAELGYLKTPWGRDYMALAQRPFPEGGMS